MPCRAGESDLPGIDIDGTAVEVRLPFERPLSTPRGPTMINSAELQPGEESFDASSLFEQVHVDLEEPSPTVRSGLLDQDQVGLAELVQQQPLQQGLAELVGYFSLSIPAL